MLCRSSLRADSTAMLGLNSRRHTLRRWRAPHVAQRAAVALDPALHLRWQGHRLARAAPKRCREGEHGHKRCAGPLVPCERPSLKARRGLQGQPWRARAQRASSTISAQLFDAANTVRAVSSAPGRKGEHHRRPRPTVGAPQSKPQTAARPRPRAEGRRRDARPCCVAAMRRKPAHQTLAIKNKAAREASSCAGQ